MVRRGSKMKYKKGEKYYCLPCHKWHKKGDPEFDSHFKEATDAALEYMYEAFGRNPPRPPKKWWNKMVKSIKKSMPRYNMEQVRKTIGNIWFNVLSPYKRREIIARENPKRKMYSITWFDPASEDGDDKTWTFYTLEDAEEFRKDLAEIWQDKPKDIMIERIIPPSQSKLKWNPEDVPICPKCSEQLEVEEDDDRWRFDPQYGSPVGWCDKCGKEYEYKEWEWGLYNPSVWTVTTAFDVMHPTAYEKRVLMPGTVITEKRDMGSEWALRIGDEKDLWVVSKRNIKGYLKRGSSSSQSKLKWNPNRYLPLLNEMRTLVYRKHMSPRDAANEIGDRHYLSQDQTDKLLQMWLAPENPRPSDKYCEFCHYDGYSLEPFEYGYICPSCREKYDKGKLTIKNPPKDILGQIMGHGDTEIWYSRGDIRTPTGHTYGMEFGFAGLPGEGKLHTFRDLVNKYIDVKDLTKSHYKMGSIKPKDLNRIYHMMQGEQWSSGQWQEDAQKLVRKSGTLHTSMSVGDIIRIGNKTYIVANYGFYCIEDGKLYSNHGEVLRSPSIKFEKEIVDTSDWLSNPIFGKKKRKKPEGPSASVLKKMVKKRMAEGQGYTAAVEAVEKRTGVPWKEIQSAYEWAENPMPQDVKTYVKEIMGWFEFDDENENYFSITTREHGDIGDERPGSEDIQKAREIARKFLAKYGKKYSVEVDTTDEWVNVDFFKSP
jgi:hypothetical protein